MWSIGIYTGSSPFQLGAPANHANPILRHADVTDATADFVADPFMLRKDGRWYMFFEMLDRVTNRGEISLATSDDGFTWAYQHVVLREPFHLSYPYVFEWQGEYYMIPETLGASALCLYKANPFPSHWSLLRKLIDGVHADPSILRFADLWWMFVCTRPFQHDILRLFFARELEGPWKEHPQSPIVDNDAGRARPAGRIVQVGGRVVRFAQDCTPDYGTRVRAFEISELSRTRYVEAEHRHSPVLSPSGLGWNAKGMHHVDAHQLDDGNWIACVDGRVGVHLC